MPNRVKTLTNREILLYSKNEVDDLIRAVLELRESSLSSSTGGGSATWGSIIGKPDFDVLYLNQAQNLSDLPNPEVALETGLGLVKELRNITKTDVDNVLSTIGTTTTVSEQQWDYLGLMDQGVAITDNVTHNIVVGTTALKGGNLAQNRIPVVTAADGTISTTSNLQYDETTESRIGLGGAPVAPVAGSGISVTEASDRAYLYLQRTTTNASDVEVFAKADEGGIGTVGNYNFIIQRSGTTYVDLTSTQVSIEQPLYVNDKLTHLYRNTSIGNAQSPTLTNAVLQIENSNGSMYLDGNTILSDVADGLYVGHNLDQPFYLTQNQKNFMVLDSYDDTAQDAIGVFKNLRSNTFSDWFSAQPAGWRISGEAMGDFPAGTGDFRLLFIDELVAKAFTADVAQALAGSDFLTKSVAQTSKSFVVPFVADVVSFPVNNEVVITGDHTAEYTNGTKIRIQGSNSNDGNYVVSSSSYASGADQTTVVITTTFTNSVVGVARLCKAVEIEVEDNEGLQDLQVFSDDDWVRFRVVDRTSGGLSILDIYGVVSNYTDKADGLQTWDYYVHYAGNSDVAVGFPIYKGSIALDYGVSGDNYIERSVLDRTGSLDYTKVPYDRVVRWTNTVSGSPRPGDPDTSLEVLTQRGNINGLGGITSATYGMYAKDNVIIDLTSGVSMRIGKDANGSNDGIYINPHNYWLTNNSFKVGNGTNYLDWTGSALNIKTGVFNLVAGSAGSGSDPSLLIDSGTSTPTQYTPADVTSSLVSNADFTADTENLDEDGDNNGFNDLTEADGWEKDNGADSPNSDATYNASANRIDVNLETTTGSNGVRVWQDQDSSLSTYRGTTLTFKWSLSTSPTQFGFGFSETDTYLRVYAWDGASRITIAEKLLSGLLSSTPADFDITAYIPTWADGFRWSIEFEETDRSGQSDYSLLYINGIEVDQYNDTQVSMNTDGFEVFSSPINYFKALNTGLEMVGMDIKTDYLQVPEHLDINALSTPDEGYVSIGATDVAGTKRIYLRDANGDLHYVVVSSSGGGGGTSNNNQITVQGGTGVDVTNGVFTLNQNTDQTITLAIDSSVITTSSNVTSLADVTDAGSGLIITSAERTKLNGIATGAEVNQNAFSNVAVSGQSTVAADGKTDTLNFAAGSNVTITTNATTDTVTIASTETDPVFTASVAFGIDQNDIDVWDVTALNVGSNQPNWDAAYTYSQIGHLPLTGGTLTGALSGTSATFSGDVTGANLNISDWDNAASFVQAGTNTDINTSGALVVDQINVTSGIVTSMTTRTLTLTEIGAAGISGSLSNSFNVNQLTAAGDVVPDTDNTGNVGTGALTWNNGQFTNLTVNSTLNVRGAIDLADNDNLRFGSGDDYIIDFNGTNLVIHENVGGVIHFTNTANTVTLTIDPTTGSVASSSTVTGSNLNITDWDDTASLVQAGTNTDVNTSGSTIVDSITVNSGIVTAMGTRVLTLANLGYTGATNADNYGSWDVRTNNTLLSSIGSGWSVDFVGGTGISINGTGGGSTAEVGISLSTAGAGAGTYGSTSNGTKIDRITLDAYGRVTAITTGATGSMSSFNVQANGGTQVAVTNAEEVNFINGTATTAAVVNQTNPTVTFNFSPGDNPPVGKVGTDDIVWYDDSAGAYYKSPINGFQLSIFNDDLGIVRATTTQTISGTKTFTSHINIGDDNQGGGLLRIDHNGSDTDAITMGDQTTFSNNTGIYFRTSGIAALSVADGGNLRIYESGPADNILADFGTASNGGAAQIAFGDEAWINHTGTSVDQFQFRTTGNTGILIKAGSTSDAYISFVTANSGTIPARMFLDSSATTFNIQVMSTTRIQATTVGARVTGSLNVSGALVKGSGSFMIHHPDPKKKESHWLKHYFVETDSAGGNLYKRQVKVINGKAKIKLKDYHKYLNIDELIFVSPYKHFGSGWGEISKDKKHVDIYADKDGVYNVLIFGDRNDETALENFDGIEVKKTER